MNKNLTMRDLPDWEKPYEKCLRKGPEALSDAELISVIIRTGSAGEKSTDLAARILQAGPDGLLNLIHLDAAAFMQIRGIGQVKALQLKCAGELSRRIASASRHIGPSFLGPQEVAAFYMERLRHETKEQVMLSMYDRKNMFLGDELITVGSSNASLVPPGEVFKAALKKGAEFIILLHNHPSGNPEPSREDMIVTQRIRECGELLEIPLMDHIIIGDNCYFSFQERGYIKRKGE